MTGVYARQSSKATVDVLRLASAEGAWSDALQSRRFAGLGKPVDPELSHPPSCGYLQDVTLRVDPKLIRFFLDFGTPRPGELRSARRDVNKRRISGIVVDDRLITRGAALETCPHVAALKERFVHGKTWEETGYIELFESWYKRINKGKYADCSWDDFKAHRLLDWDDVFQDIREHEYRPAKRPVDNVEVAISDKGEILAVDGRHRLYFAQILGIQSIPIIVNLIAASMVERAQSVTELEKILSR